MVSSKKKAKDLPKSANGKKENSYQRANFLSKIWFCWMMPTFWRGYKRELREADLSEPQGKYLSDKLGDRLEAKWLEEVKRADDAGRKPSLNRALVRAFWWDYMPSSILVFIPNMVLRPFQPMVLGFLLNYWEPGSDMRSEQAIILAAIVVLMSLFITFCNHHATYDTTQFGMKIRIACCSLIYRKILRMSSGALAQTTAGQVVNLLSNDVNRFDYAFMYTHYIWILPLQMAMVCYLIYTRIGYAAVIGVVGIVLQTLPVQSYMSKLAAKLRLKTAGRTDERVRIMDEIIGGIQVIKMYAWERPFEKVVELARGKEIDTITSASYLRGVYLSFMVFTERLTLYVTLLAYSLFGYAVTADIIFPLAQYFNMLQGTLSIIMSNAVALLSESLISIKRLEQFMLLDERIDLRGVPGVDIQALANKKHIEKEIRRQQKIDKKEGNIQAFRQLDVEGLWNSAFESEKEKPFSGIETRRASVVSLGAPGPGGVVLQDVNASWTGDIGAMTLKGLSMRFREGKLCAVIGSVGSGKSSLLQLLLNELQPGSGRVTVNGSISYSSQEPWLFVASVRQNILFGLPYDSKKYKEVVKVCALQKDFQQFPYGDNTMVGERGVSLSGGQRARINLARAVYRQADIYLMDDPLSAVDAHVGKQLFDTCIKGYLRGKTRILVTHQLHYLKAADQIIILNNGAIENIGTYAELVNSGKEFAQLLAALQEEQDDDVEKVDELNRHGANRHSVRLRRQSSTVSSEGGRSDFGSPGMPCVPDAADEERAEGGMGWRVYGAYLRAGGSPCLIACTVALLLIGQLSATFCDYWVTYWTNQAALKTAAMTNSSNTPVLQDEETGEVGVASALLNITPLYHNLSGATLDLNEPIGRFNTYEYLYIYTALTVACITLVTARAILYFRVCMNASINLHNAMFRAMLQGVMRFFDTNPSGRILNRFSKDVGALDELLPRFLMECIQVYLVMFSILSLNAVALYWTLPPTLVILGIFYVILQIYLKSAQAIKRLEGTTRSPVFSHLAATLNGVSTIRSAGAQQRLIREFDIHQDVHTSTWSSYLASGASLGFWLDIICVVYLGMVIVIFLSINIDGVFAGNVGLAISQTLILTGMLQFGIRQTAEVVSQMTSVERILQYTTIQTENNWEEGTKATPKPWPSAGRVEFRHTSMRYSLDELPVLKDLNVVIESGWKVGIVGRTGAGKSSLISSLFRLALVEGDVIIDGVETGTVGLQELRSKISIIPQEPVLFSATVRYNLDPFNEYDDTAIWQALEAVDLKEAVPALDFKVSEGGGNFSLGQRQLVCLARAILRSNRILVLDEATANVDPQTDAFIQDTIRRRFADCTVLTIAHRLNTIMDSDRVMVLEAGRLAEFAPPHELLRDARSKLAGMARDTGDKMAAQLREAAENAHRLRGGDATDEKGKDD